VKQPGQSDPDTLSYDRPRPQDRAGKQPPADYPTTSVLPDGPVEGDSTEDGATARVRPLRTDPLAVGPAPHGSLSLTPPETPGSPVEPTTGAFRPGEQVDHFEIVGLVGKGGMGCVYKAFDRNLGRTVAIKTLHGIDQHQPNALARFRREAQAASRVVHPNLVIIYSSGTHGDTPYIVMEYLSGRSLAAEIAEGPLSVERTADVLGAACAGVYAAHRAHVVHRDLKPANIFLARTPMGETPKILDFGISRVGGDEANLTGTGDIIGTTYYLAPEQAAGREIDARADQHALGVILYECLTGVRPFTGSTAYAIMRDIVEGIFQPPSRLRPEIPRGLEAVILRAMKSAPDDRFAHVRDLGLALIPFMSTKGRQQWSYHFTAPEAEMPIAPSTAVPTPSGAEARPAPTEVAPAQPPAPAVAPTKILPVGQPEPWQVVLTRTTPASVPLLAPAVTGPSLRRSHAVAVAVTAALVVLIALAAWVLRPSVVHETARPAPSVATAVKVTPTATATSSAPVATAPAVPEAPPTRTARPADNSPKPAEGRNLAPRHKATAKVSRPREAIEPSDTTRGRSKHGADDASEAPRW
jgi:serine/threonine-protein kinase